MVHSQYSMVLFAVYHGMFSYRILCAKCYAMAFIYLLGIIQFSWEVSKAAGSLTEWDGTVSVLFSHRHLSATGRQLPRNPIAASIDL